MQTRNFLVQVLRQYVDFIIVILTVLPQFDLGQDLVAERIRHDETGMTGSATKIYKAAFGQENDSLAVREYNVINLRLDVFPFELVQVRDIDLVIKVADVADDRLIPHALHLRTGNNMVVAGGSNDDIHLVANLVEYHNAVAFHRRLQSTNRVDLGDQDGGAQPAQ